MKQMKRDFHKIKILTVLAVLTVFYQEAATKKNRHFRFFSLSPRSSRRKERSSGAKSLNSQDKKGTRERACARFRPPLTSLQPAAWQRGASARRRPATCYLPAYRLSFLCTQPILCSVCVHSSSRRQTKQVWVACLALQTFPGELANRRLNKEKSRRKERPQTAFTAFLVAFFLLPPSSRLWGRQP